MRQPQSLVRGIGNTRRASAGISVRVRIVMSPQTRQRSLLIVDITRDVKVAVHLDRSVILQFDKTARGVNQPQFTNRCSGGAVYSRTRALQ
jgi:hypothetical protein